jgi:hypothetical protein
MLALQEMLLRFEQRTPLAEHRRDASNLPSPAHATYATSAATPSKSHAAPATPYSRKTEKHEDYECAESPTNSQPHTGPIFLKRPPTPSKPVGPAAATPHTHTHTPAHTHKWKALTHTEKGLQGCVSRFSPFSFVFFFFSFFFSFSFFFPLVEGSDTPCKGAAQIRTRKT